MTDTAPPDAFHTHLIELIAAYQRAHSSNEPLPRYDGPRDSQTEAILIGLGEVARRMWTAEETLARSQNPYIAISEKSSATISDQAPATLPPPIPATSDTGFSIEDENACFRALVTDAARVCSAVSKGDLNQKIIVPAKGSEMANFKENVNAMVDKLGHVSDQVIGILRQHNKGMLGGQITVPDTGGAWFVLVRNVNGLCTCVTDQVRNIAHVTKSVSDGDLTQRIQIHCEGEMSMLKSCINAMVDDLSANVCEVIDLALEIGTFGILGGQVSIEGLSGSWADLTRNVNRMASTMTAEVRSINEVAKAVALGDLSKFVDVDLQGEILEMKLTVNAMVSQLSTVADQVTRVSLEVGTEGILGGQAAVPDVQGTWKALADSVNLMASNCTNQTRSMAEVAKAITAGDLSKKIEVDAQGEFLDLKFTVNHMTESLNLYATEMTRVAREAGVENVATDGVQAEVQGFDGTWRHHLTLVNTMARGSAQIPGATITGTH